MPVPIAVLAAPADQWLPALSIAALAVAGAGTVVHRRARSGAAPRGTRRRAGALLALGPLVGFLVAPTAGDHVAVAALGAVALAAVGLGVERRPGAHRLISVAALVAAVVAAADGLRFGPTGVAAVDVGVTVLLVWGTAFVFDGFGNADGVVPAVGAASAFGALALAVFAEQAGPANVAAGVVGGCLGFLVFNARPASLFAGRAGRAATGYAVAVVALSVEPAIAVPGALVVALLVLAVPLLDATITLLSRLRDGRPLVGAGRDHLVHRLAAAGASPAETVAVLVIAQAACSVVAVLVGRGVLAPGLGAGLGAAALVAVGVRALRGPVPAGPRGGPTRGAAVGLVVVGALVALAVVPSLLAVDDVAGRMQDGRAAAAGALAAARRGDAVEARLGFEAAGDAFADASSRLDGPLVRAGAAVPGLAANVRAARELADIGRDLAAAGEDVAGTVDPEALAVVDGRVPLDEVRRVTPALERGAAALAVARRRLRQVDDPYLLAPVHDALRTIGRELEQAAAEARRTAAGARLAPAILGGGPARRYLLVVQNNAEARPTGGFVGSFGVLTAVDGEVRVGRLRRTAAWNAAVGRAGARLDAPADYRRRYGSFRPEATLQNVNLSPDFPTVAGVLERLAPAAGVGPVDGVLSVDPVGLAALLRLTGPVSVPGWPEPITADNVVRITLRDAYRAFAETPERAEFLGDVAQAVVDQATVGRLGSPARVAEVLGAAAHGGHIALGFADPAEQRLARRLAIAGAAPAARADVAQATTANAGGNKLDYYLRRVLDYRVALAPDADARAARATGRITLRLANTAPARGLPRIVAGPYEGTPNRTVAGENLTYVSLYSSLAIGPVRVDGAPLLVRRDRELGRNVASGLVAVRAGADAAVTAPVRGRIGLGHGGWYRLRLAPQPGVVPEYARVTVGVPPGWRIAAAPGLRRLGAREAGAVLRLERPRTVRVRVVRAPASLDLWRRLDVGT